jgi:predicted O-linked N-acetylglucosamine transferase (SPINDLY family)
MQQQKRAQQAIKRAVLCYQRGNLREAELLYSDILRAQPQHFDALQLLGALRIAQRNYEGAVDLIRRAVLIHPHFPKAHYNLGLALLELQRPREALECFDCALALAPDYPEALIRRAEALLKLDRAQDALASCDRALVVNPGYGPAYYSRGLALGSLAKHDEAMASIDRAIALTPDNAQAFCQRGEALFLAGGYPEALESFDRALQLRASFPRALCGRGDVLVVLDRHEEAVESFSRALEQGRDNVEALSKRGATYAVLRRYDDAMADYAAALAIAPAHRDTLYNRGVTLVDLRRCEEAIGSFQTALAAHPGDARSLNNCGFALSRLRRFQEAIACFDGALALQPGLFEAQTNRADALRMLGRYEEAAAACEAAFAINPEATRWYDVYFYSLQFACQWRDFDDHERRVREELRKEDSLTAPLIVMGIGSDPAEQLACARRFARFVSRRCQPLPESLEPSTDGARIRIRVAYLSANFNEHPVAHAIVDLLERHDRAKFEIIAISFGPDDRSDIRARVVGAVDEFHEVRDRSDRDIAALIRDRHVDIAVDLMGHTDDARPSVLAHRPAPVQVSYLGYPGTMGAPFIDYILADAYVIPAGQSDHYEEHVARLPHCYFPSDSRRRVANGAAARTEHGLPERGFVFCCFNTHYKITPTLFAVWMRLLAAIEGSVLWLQGNNACAERNLRNEARSRGVDPDRLVFATRVGREEHLLRYRVADLFLDTFPYNAHSTACDALWMGLPLVTCSGTTFASRVAGSLLQAAGLPEGVTTSLEGYEARARMLATNERLLADLRAKLAANRPSAPLFDSDRLRRHVERAYTTMLDMRARGGPPQDFFVAES